MYGVWTADINLTLILVGLSSGLIGSFVGVLGSRWIALEAVKRQEKTKKRLLAQESVGGVYLIVAVPERVQEQGYKPPGFQ